MKKKFALLALCVLTVLAMAGCTSKEAEYPVLESPEKPDDMTEESYGGYTGSYDADDWVFDSSLDMFQIYDKEVYENGNPDGNCPNINVAVSQEFDGPLTEEDMNALMDELDSVGVDGFSIEKNEMRTLDGQPVIYYECKTVLTDEMIDLLIESGNITEDDITALGGRDVLKDMGESLQIGIAAVVDGNIIIVTGTYYGDDKDDVTDAMILLIETGKVS